MYYKIVIYSCDGNGEFSAVLPQSSVSRNIFMETVILFLMKSKKNLHFQQIIF